MAKRNGGAGWGPAGPLAGGYALRGHDCGVMDDIERLKWERDRIDVEIGAAVLHARNEHGISWARIGAAVNLTKQGAQKRYGSFPVEAPR